MVPNGTTQNGPVCVTSPRQLWGTLGTCASKWKKETSIHIQTHASVFRSTQLLAVLPWILLNKDTAIHHSTWIILFDLVSYFNCHGRTIVKMPGKIPLKETLVLVSRNKPSQKTLNQICFLLWHHKHKATSGCPQMYVQHTNRKCWSLWQSAEKAI